MSVPSSGEGLLSFGPDNGRFRHSRAVYLDKNSVGAGRDSNGSDEITFKRPGNFMSGQFLAKVPKGWILLAC
ncbi:MAG TPA: hypothetical protein VIM40_13885, partial [Arthrobacter sp.]